MPRCHPTRPPAVNVQFLQICHALVIAFIFLSHPGALYAQDKKARANPAASPQESNDEGGWQTMDAVEDLGVVDSPAERPRPISQSLPNYPAAARRAGIEGEVVVEFIVDPNGDVVGAFAARSTDQRLDAAAVAAVQKWKFKPGRKHGRAIATRLQVPVIFSLKSDSPSGTYQPDAATLARITRERTAYPIDGKPDVRATPRFQANPAYPIPLRIIGLEGQVVVEFIVDQQGNVQTAFARRSTHPDFEPSAIEAVSRWKFSPATTAGKPVNMLVQVPIVFTLTKENKLLTASEATLQKIRNDRRNYKLGITPAKPSIKTQSAPKYPEAMRKAGIEGVVVVDFIVNRHGKVTTAFALRSSHREFEKAAVETVNSWVFHPKLEKGKPVDSHLMVPIIFELDAQPVTPEPQ